MEALLPATAEMETLLPSTAGMETLLPSTAGMEALLPSTALLPSNAEMEALLPSTAGMETLLPSTSGMEALLPSTAGMEALLPSTSGMEALPSGAAESGHVVDLVDQISRMTERIIRSLDAVIRSGRGFGYGHFRVLRVLPRDGAGMMTSPIARRVGCTRRNVDLVLRRLGELGLVEQVSTSRGAAFQRTELGCAVVGAGEARIAKIARPMLGSVARENRELLERMVAYAGEPAARR